MITCSIIRVVETKVTIIELDLTETCVNTLVGSMTISVELTSNNVIYLSIANRFPRSCEIWKAIDMPEVSVHHRPALSPHFQPSPVCHASAIRRRRSTKPSRQQQQSSTNHNQFKFLECSMCNVRASHKAATIK